MNVRRIKEKLRPVYVPFFKRHPTARAIYSLVTPPLTRTPDFVTAGYSNMWGLYRARLEASETLASWMCIPGFDDAMRTQHLAGRTVRSTTDTNRYWVDQIERAIREHFPRARSITEYGCGVGRNLLALKQRFPKMACYGYELVDEGVEVAKNAAAKFGQDIAYAKLDYVRDPEASYVHPRTDVAFTCWSLAEVPDANLVGVKNMLNHAQLGTIHIEPVAENYPRTYWGVLGRFYARRIDFMHRFDRGVRALGIKSIHVRVLDTSPNPLEPNPSLYVLEH